VSSNRANDCGLAAMCRLLGASPPKVSLHEGYATKSADLRRRTLVTIEIPIES
jgi:hypothetical protein